MHLDSVQVLCCGALKLKDKSSEGNMIIDSNGKSYIHVIGNVRVYLCAIVEDNKVFTEDVQHAFNINFNHVIYN